MQSSVTNLISLRAPEARDIPQIVALANNPKIADNLRDSFPHPYSVKDAELFIEMASRSSIPNRFVIEKNGAYVGNIGIHPQDDIYRYTAELGYFIGEEHWGQGIATIAVKLAVKHAFETMELQRVFAGVFSHNPASARVLEKAGFDFECVARKALVKNGAMYDEIRYAILNPSSLEVYP